MARRAASSMAGRSVVTSRSLVVLPLGELARRASTGSRRRTSATWSKARSGLTISVMPSCTHVATWTRSRAASSGISCSERRRHTSHQCVGDRQDRGKGVHRIGRELPADLASANCDEPMEQLLHDLDSTSPLPALRSRSRASPGGTAHAGDARAAHLRRISDSCAVIDEPAIAHQSPSWLRRISSFMTSPVVNRCVHRQHRVDRPLPRIAPGIDILVDGVA